MTYYVSSGTLNPTHSLSYSGVYLEELNIAQKSNNLTVTPVITWKQYNIIYRFILFTNRKLHMGFRSVPKSVTLSDLGWPSGRHQALFHTVSQLLEPTVSNSLKSHTVSDRNVVQRV